MVDSVAAKNQSKQKVSKLGTYGGGGTGSHAFDPQEPVAFAAYINKRLCMDTELKGILPLGNGPTELFDACINGVMICKVIALFSPEALMGKKIIVKPKNKFEEINNLNYALDAVRTLKVTVSNVSAEDIHQGAEKGYLTLGVVWQVVRLALAKEVADILASSQDEHLKDTDGIPDTPEETLLKWVNYVLAFAEHSSRRMTNFGVDVADSEIYVVLLNTLDRTKCPLSALEKDANGRAEQVCKSAKVMDVLAFVTEGDITEGNARLNFGFVATMFRKYGEVDLVKTPAPALCRTCAYPDLRCNTCKKPVHV